jgi:hypothetical protein
VASVNEGRVVKGGGGGEISRRRRLSRPPPLPPEAPTSPMADGAERWRGFSRLRVALVPFARRGQHLSELGMGSSPKVVGFGALVGDPFQGLGLRGRPTGVLIVLGVPGKENVFYVLKSYHSDSRNASFFFVNRIPQFYILKPGEAPALGTSSRPSPAGLAFEPPVGASHDPRYLAGRGRRPRW